MPFRLHAGGGGCPGGRGVQRDILLHRGGGGHDPRADSDSLINMPRQKHSGPSTPHCMRRY